jgi:pimeloyl-ACP methyl ester carboxylesterase
MSTQDRFLDTDGARLRWRLEGNGPVLVLLHGWAMDLAYWNPVVPALAREFSLLRFDRRGFGLSEGQPDIHRNVGDLRAVLEASRTGRAVLVGMSQGARLALHFARSHPAHVRALVLDGAPALDAEPELPLARFRQRLQADGIAALRADILEHPLMQLRDGNAGGRKLLQDMLARYGGHDLLRAVARAQPPELGDIRSPALVLNGAHDSQARRKAGRELCASIVGAQRVELPAAGHLALLDDPAGYVAEIVRFCRVLPP